jgi:hypothetical protein
MAVTNNSSASLSAVVGTIVNTKGAAAFTITPAGGGVPLAKVGDNVYGAISGWMGTIATVDGAGAVGTFTAVTTVETTVGDSVRVGARVGVSSTGNGITAGNIVGFSTVAGSTVGLDVIVTGPPATTSKVRASFNVAGVAGTSVAMADVNSRRTLVSFTAPTTAGTYAMTVQTSVLGTFALAFPATDAEVSPLAFTLTVTAAADYSAPLSTAFLGAANVAATTAATDLTGIASFSNSVTGTIAARVDVAIKDTSALALAGVVLTAVISGPGFVNADVTAPAARSATRTEAVTTTSTGAAVFEMYGDGTSGVSTLTISATNLAGVTTTLATKSITYFGAVTTVAVNKANFTIFKAAGGTSPTLANPGYIALANRINATDIPAFVIKLTDSQGNPATSAAVPTALSSDATVVTGATCAQDIASAANLFSSGGTGFYNCLVTTPTSAASGKSATLTFRIVNPADATGLTFLTAAAVTVTIGGTTPTTETLTLDSASYTPGSPILVTRTAVDASGNPVADGTASPAVAANKALGGTSPIAAGIYVGGKSLSSTTLATAGTAEQPRLEGQVWAGSSDFCLMLLASNHSGGAAIRYCHTGA